MELEQISLKVCELAKVAGKYILEQKQQVRREDIEVKGEHDFVTYVDKHSEEIIVNGLLKIIPEAGIIAEEGSYTEGNGELKWVIDPLDGTTNFLHGVPVFSVSIGLMESDKVISGVVYEINRDECFYAWKGSQSMLNGRQIQVSKTREMPSSLIATGFPYTHFQKVDPYLDLFKELMKSSSGLRRLGSAAADLAYVACGRFEGFYEYGLNPWDVSAGTLIVKQAGGTVTDFKGGKNFVFGRTLVSSNGIIHHELLNTIIKHFGN
jgi:myo-inositol-1(or 4)-monophosphatase